MPKQDESDVKEFEETVHVDDSDDSSDDTEDKEETDIEDDSSDEEKDTSTDSSTEKKPDSEDDDVSDKKEDDSSDEDDKPDKVNEPLKDGIVETPREKALRLEVDRLRGDNRSKKTDELFAGSDVSVKKTELSEDKKDRLKKYDPKEIENLREVLDVMADDLGFIKKDEFQKTSYSGQAKNILDDFLEVHKEYDPINDKDDVLWNRFRSEFKLYKVPENPRDLKKLFNKIHNDVVGIKPSSDLRKIEANKEKIDSASHSASKNKSNKRAEQVVDRSQSSVTKEDARRGLKGFTDEEIDDLLS